MINDEAGEIIEELYDSLKSRYQNNLKPIKGNDFVFNYFHLLYYTRHKINPNCGESYVDSSDWIKKKKQQQIISIKNIINAFNML